MISGHVSLYRDIGRDWHGALHVGRYLAGDWGATLELTRQFANGWSIGAYATLTDVPFSTFGEGSFDKGILLRIPLSTVTHRATRQRADIVLQPISRDGGARVHAPGRLYDAVRNGSLRRLRDTQGRIWR